MLCVLCSLSTANAQDYYKASTIPANLKAGAHVIKRFEENIFQVKDIDKASYRIHQVFTVLDEEGSDALFFYIHTSKQVKIDDVDIRLYDSTGKMISKFKKKDLRREASQSQFVDDYMYHYISLTPPGYPATVEYDYEVINSGTLAYPRYDIQDADEAVEYSSFTAVVPPDLDLRFLEQKVSLKPAITNEAKNKVYKWEIKNLLAFKSEEGAAGPVFTDPAIILAPNKFRHFNTYGDLSSWKSFGQWGYDLLKGLDELPPARKAFLNNLVKDAKNDREKIAIIYKYMQDNFRYVSIQLGIGGVKPFPASFTDENKYGDCKGLSLYMLAALKAVGIKSYCAFINAEYNQEPVKAEFPCDRFNHVILCVPQGKDSIWLECTSNTADFAVLGSFTENRNALLLTENGGVLVSTPKSRSSDNLMSTTTNIQLNDDGSGITTTNVTSLGDFRELMDVVVKAKKDDQKRIIMRSLGFKQPDEFSIKMKSADKAFDVNIDLSIEKIPQFSAGSKMFLNPRIYAIWKSVLPKADNRKQDYYFHGPFTRIDTTIYNLPKDYVAESVPNPVDLKCDYGTYSVKYTYAKDKNQLITVAKLELLQHHIPAAKYADIKKFFDAVISEENLKLIVKSN